MSVQTNQYLMLGVKLPFVGGEAEHEKYEGYYDSAYKGIQHKDGLCVVADGMNGEYLFIGRVLEKSEVHEQLDGPMDLASMVENINNTQRELLAELIKIKFGIENPDVRLWFFTHYR